MTSPSTPRLSVDSLCPISPTPSRNEYPFPRLVPGVTGLVHGTGSDSARPGSTGRYQSRRGSAGSSIHSVGGSLDTPSHRHGLSEYGQNGKCFNFNLASINDNLKPYLPSSNHPLSEPASSHTPLLQHQAHIDLPQPETFLQLLCPIYRL